MEVFNNAKTQFDTKTPQATTTIQKKVEPVEENVVQNELQNNLNIEDQKNLVEKLNAQIESLSTNLSFGFSDKLGQIIVTVRDKENGAVIREFPTKDALRLAEKMKDFVGMLFDERV